MYVLEEGKFRRVYLLSYDVGIVAGLDFEGAVVCPEIDGISDTCNTAFVDLLILALSQRRKITDLPSRRLQCQLLRTPDLHTSSNTQRTMGTWQESDRRHCAPR